MATCSVVREKSRKVLSELSGCKICESQDEKGPELFWNELVRKLEMKIRIVGKPYTKDLLHRSIVLKMGFPYIYTASP